MSSSFKRNQVEEAIVQTLDPSGERAGELKLGIKRLLVTDRRLGPRRRSTKAAGGRCAFHSAAPPGSGVEVMFSSYEAFAVLAGLILLGHGIPQGAVVSILRQVRGDLEVAHGETLNKNAHDLFNPKVLRAMGKPGTMATDNTHPVFLIFVKVAEVPGGKGEVRSLVSVCRGIYEATSFIKQNSAPGFGATSFEFVSLMRRLNDNLAKTRPVKRGRSII
jgi:hypothetical protein